MASIYPGKVLANATAAFPPGTAFENQRLKNVSNSFVALPNSGQFINCRFVRHQFPQYRLTSKIFKKNTKGKNHFQGIVRLRDGKHFVASIADLSDKFSILALFKIESHLDIGLEQNGPVRSNRIFSLGNRKDKIVELFHINKGEPKLWHPGGLGIMGDILVVPLENFDADITRVDFYNFFDANNPEKLDFSINTKQNANVNTNERFGAATICKIDNGFFFCALWSDPKGLFRIYRSKTKKLEDGFFEGNNHLAEIAFDDIVDIKDNHNDNKFQSIQFAQDQNGGLFIIASANYSGASPTIGGENYSILLKVDFDTDNMNNFSLTYLEIKVFLSENDYSNFDAGLGLYIPDAEQIALYSMYHWRSKDHLKLSEFHSRSVRNPRKSNDSKDSFIELYSEKRFQGRSLILYADDLQDIKNYKDITVQKKHFNDEANSLRYRLPDGFKYELYEHNNFNKDKDGNRITLLGTGLIGQFRNLDDINTPGLFEKKAFGGKISSSQFVD